MLLPVLTGGFGMIAQAIRFSIRNLPALLLVLAVLLALARRRPAHFPERLLGWVMLLPIGVTGLWAGAFHVFLPGVSAAMIGWQTSPFQFEVGMADLAIGITACVSFWRGLAFKAAAIWAASVFLLGDAVGHVRQMIEAGNFAPGNAGTPFVTDILCPALAILLLALARRRASPAA